MNSPVSIAVHGATGRMGRAVIRIASARDDVEVVAAITRSGSDHIGARASDADSSLTYTDALAQAVAPRVAIDFSTPDAFDAVLDTCVARGIALVSGTTGLGTAQRDALDRASRKIAVLWSANFSLGVALLEKLVREAARALPEWDAEIIEAHHARKIDAPSGTALSLGRSLADARGVDFDAVARFDRGGARESGTIGFAVSRGGDIVGEHEVRFAGAGERIELVHRATDRDIFARGAVEAAVWIAHRPPGRYALADVLAARG